MAEIVFKVVGERGGEKLFTADALVTSCHSVMEQSNLFKVGMRSGISTRAKGRVLKIDQEGGDMIISTDVMNTCGCPKKYHRPDGCARIPKKILPLSEKFEGKVNRVAESVFLLAKTTKFEDLTQDEAIGFAILTFYKMGVIGEVHHAIPGSDLSTNGNFMLNASYNYVKSRRESTSHHRLGEVYQGSRPFITPYNPERESNKLIKMMVNYTRARTIDNSY